MIFSLICALALCGSASADDVALNTTHNGTVSGGLYVNATQPVAWTNQTASGVTSRDFNQTFNLPINGSAHGTDVQWAEVYVNIYSGSGSANWPLNATILLDGDGDGVYETTLGNELLTSDNYNTDGTVYRINDHCTRVYSDYQLCYNVTGLITCNNPSIYVKTEQVGTSSYDGRLKMIALVAAYNDGDNDKVDYWVNDGQDWISSGTSETTFKTSIVTNTVTNATLNTVALSSKDGSYTFNGEKHNGTNPVDPVNYFETHTWNVTSQITPGNDSTLTYTAGNGSFKNVLATLTLRETPVAPTANFTANTTSGSDPLGVTFTDESTGTITGYSWDFGDNSTSTEENPKHTYTKAGTYTVKETVTGPGGNDTKVMNNYITVLPQCDLEVTGVTIPVNGPTVFPGETNNVTVTIKNNGPDASQATTVNLYASDVTSGPVASVNVPALASEEEVTIFLTDPTIRPITANTTYKNSNASYVTYTANVDPLNTVPESNENNNQLASTACPVYYNGYKGKQYEYGGNDSTQRSYDLRGDLVYSIGDSTYGNKKAGYTVKWNSTDLTIPAGATIKEAWLYMAYTWDSSNLFPNNMHITFDGQNVSYVRWYYDLSNFGGWGSGVYGMLTYNVTSLFQPNAENNVTIFNSTGSAALYPFTLMVVYEDSNSTEKQIFINDGYDLLGVDKNYGTTIDEATAYTQFNGTIKDISKVKSAKLITSTSATGNGEGNLLFNGNTLGLNVWKSTNTYWYAVDVRDVKDYLNTSNNTVGIQETSSCLGADQQFLVVEYNEPVPVANFTANTTNGTLPLVVQFTDKSTGYITSYAWDFDGDGNVDSTAQNPSYTYTKSGNYTVKETVTGPGGSDSTTSIITVNAPDLVVTNVTANNGTGGCMFANELNVISVTVENNGTAAAPESTLNVNINGTDYIVNVPALAVGESTTVTVTDPVSRKDGDSVPVNTTTNPNNTIPETNTSNNSFSTNLTVYNNGYKGKRYTDGSDIDTQSMFQGNYGVEYSSGNSAYSGSKWTSNNVTWTSSQLPIPSGATVTQVRLYQPYTWDATSGQPHLNVIFNGGNVVNYIGWYTDSKGFGSYNYPSGLFVYDVTSLFNTAGNTLNMTPGTGTSLILYGSYLVVVYQDPNTTNKTIIINDGCDLLCSNPKYSVNDTESAAYANFQNVNTSKAVNAKVIDVLASADGDGGANQAFFNGNVVGSFNSDYLKDPEIGFSLFNITSLLQNGTNTAAMQSHNNATKGDNMVALSSLLIVEYDTVAPTVSADINGGSYNASQSVNLTALDDQDSNPSIYYTTDGSDPTTSSTKYAGSISVAKTTTLKFIAVDIVGNQSPVQSVDYVIDTVAPTVSADINGGSYNASQSVNLTALDDQDSNPSIYYTTDGSDPTTSSTKYTGSISVAKTTTLKFMAVDAADNHSNICNETYTIPDADVYVNSTVSETNPKVGDTVTVTLKVGNNGPDTAHGVVVTYTVPEGMEFVGATTDTPSASAPVYNATTRTVTWNLGDVPVGDPKLFVTLKVLSAGKLAGSAFVTSTSHDPISNDDTGSITVEAVNAQSSTGQSTVGQEGSSVANAAEVTTTSKVPMQKTGIPLAGFALAALSIFGGLLVPRRK